MMWGVWSAAPHTPHHELVGLGNFFEAVEKGQTILHLDYKRPWETGAAPAKTFEVTVVVK